MTSSSKSAFWFVADMDGTITEKPGYAGGEKYKAKALDEGPCMAPLVRWLRLGGKALIVTSDDGNVPQRKVWQCVPAELRKDRNLLLSTSDGAALWYDDEKGNIIADTNYITAASSSGGSTGLSNQHMDAILGIARDMHLSFFRDLIAERNNMSNGSPMLMPQLSEMHQNAYEKVLNCVASGEQSLDDALSMDNLLHFNRITKGSMLWRNQPGPVESWAGYVPHDPNDQEARRAAFASFCETHPDATYTNLFVMGMPRSISAKYIAEAEPKLRELGLSISAAPNTVCIKNAKVDKSLPLHYLSGVSSSAVAGGTTDEGEPELMPPRAFAFGDNPAGNDAPLASFPGVGAFFSVAPSEEETPEAIREKAHVGGLEYGTAVVLNRLCDMLEKQGQQAAADGPDLDSLVADASKLSTFVANCRETVAEAHAAAAARM